MNTAIQFALSPLAPVRSSNSIHYSFGFSIANPLMGTTVRLADIVFTVYGPNGAVYGTFTTHFNQDLTPGSSIGGATGGFNDSNLTRPLATRYTGRLTYIHDGRTVGLERESTFPPPM